MPIDPDEVRRLSRLARLEIGDAEAARLERDLPRIVEFIDSLEEVELPDDADALTYFDSDVHREDRAGEGLRREEALFNAPETDGIFFLVPRIVEKQPEP
jgi:aspartyl-tRNA(Asn)/glutamyl-tRNA(Gln) amidotransferase subunit C